jgi:hypothetical protein
LLARNSKPIRRGGGGGKSENPAALAGFSSEVGKSGILDFSTERLFPRPFYPQIVPQILFLICANFRSHIVGAGSTSFSGEVRLPAYG